MRTHVITRALTLGAIAITAVACGQPAATPEASVPAVRSEYSKDGRLTQLSSDRDGDGKVDTWGFMDGARVVRVEIDENADGKVDRWEYHSGGQAPGAPGAPAAQTPNLAPDKTIERIERSTRHDGTVNRKEFFEAGQLVRVEEDADADGRIDKWETYADGTLTLMALDTLHRGTPDRRIVYDKDGAFQRIETDANGSGHFTPLTQ